MNALLLVAAAAGLSAPAFEAPELCHSWAIAEQDLKTAGLHYQRIPVPVDGIAAVIVVSLAGTVSVAVEDDNGCLIRLDGAEA